MHAIHLIPLQAFLDVFVVEEVEWGAAKQARRDAREARRAQRRARRSARRGAA